jgi:glyoxylase-like metal-dependent hydrolase (beta-lactamase superfamily II)
MIKITNIGTFARNNWILETARGIIAVDSGLPGQTEGFLKRFRKNWQMDELRYIFLTHAHNDHAGFLAELLEKTEARLVLCEESRVILAAGHYTESYEYTNCFGKILEKAAASPMGKYPAVTDISRMDIVGDNDKYFENMGIHASVIFLRGHTSDSIGLYLPDEGIMICGDAAMNRPPLNADRHTVVIRDMDEYHRSWDRMLALNVGMVYPGHGKPFPASDLVKHRDSNY